MLWLAAWASRHIIRRDKGVMPFVDLLVSSDSTNYSWHGNLWMVQKSAVKKVLRRISRNINSFSAMASSSRMGSSGCLPP